MRLFKLITGGLILAIIGLFVWQNIPTFTTALPFQLDLYIREHLQWSLKLYSLLAAAALIGLLLGVAVMLRPYFHVRRLLAHERQERHSVHPTEPKAPPAQEKTEQPGQPAQD